MATANFEEAPSAPASRRPADYYSSPPGPARVPPGVTLGCGGAALVALLVVFAGGAFLAGGGLPQLMDMVLGVSLGEMRGMYTKDVTVAQKEALEREFEVLRESLRTEKLSVTRLDPVLKAMRSGVADEEMSGADVAALTHTVKAVNQRTAARQ